MSHEIERRFLPRFGDENWRHSVRKKLHITQGYLPTRDPHETKRIRIIDDKEAFLCIKGRREGSKRPNIEEPIDLDHGRAVLISCGTNWLTKVRHLVDFRGKLFEIDVFGGDLAPLIIIEVELQEENELVELPAWVGDEITSLAGYSNSSLAAHGKPAIFKPNRELEAASR